MQVNSFQISPSYSLDRFADHINLKKLAQPMVDRLEKEVGECRVSYVEPCVSEVNEGNSGFRHLSEQIQYFLEDEMRATMVLTGYTQTGKTFATQMYTLNQWTLPTSDYLVLHIPLDQIEDPFHELLEQAFRLCGIDFSKNLGFKNFVASQNILLIFDGYDRIHFKHKTHLNRSICFTNFFCYFKRAKFLFTCERNFYKEYSDPCIFQIPAPKSGFIWDQFRAIDPFVCHLLPFQHFQVLDYIDKALKSSSTIPHYPFFKERIYAREKTEKLLTGLKFLVLSLYTSIFKQAILFNPFLEAEGENPKREIKRLCFSALSHPAQLKDFVKQVLDKYKQWVQSNRAKAKKGRSKLLKGMLLSPHFMFAKGKKPLNVFVEGVFSLYTQSLDTFVKDVFSSHPKGRKYHQLTNQSLKQTWKKVTYYHFAGTFWPYAQLKNMYDLNFFKDHDFLIKNLICSQQETSVLRGKVREVCMNLENFSLPPDFLQQRDYAAFLKKQKIDPPDEFTESEIIAIMGYMMSTEEERKEYLEEDRDLQELLDRYEREKVKKSIM